MDEITQHTGEPAPTPRRAAWGLRDMLWAGLAAVGLVGVGVLLAAVVIVLRGVQKAQTTLESTLLVLALEALLLLPAWYWGPRKYGGGWAGLGLRRFGWAKGLLLCFLGLPALLVINWSWELLRRAWGLPGQPEVLPLFGPGPGGLALALLMGGIVAPVAEEVFFRGFLYAGLRSRLGLLWGLLLSAMIFAVSHLTPGVLPPILLMGAGFALLYEITGSIWPSIALHSAINTLALVAAYVTQNTAPGS